MASTRGRKGVVEGYLTKLGGLFKTWRVRFFRYQPNTGKLFYYESAHVADLKREVGAKGSIPVINAFLYIYGDNQFQRPFCFGIKPPITKRTYIISAKSQDDRREWITALVRCGAHPPAGFEMPPQETEDSVRSSVSRQYINTKGHAANIKVTADPTDDDSKAPDDANTLHHNAALSSLPNAKKTRQTDASDDRSAPLPNDIQRTPSTNTAKTAPATAKTGAKPRFVRAVTLQPVMNTSDQSLRQTRVRFTSLDLSADHAGPDDDVKQQAAAVQDATQRLQNLAHSVAFNSPIQAARTGSSANADDSKSGDLQDLDNALSKGPSRNVTPPADVELERVEQPTVSLTESVAVARSRAASRALQHRPSAAAAAGGGNAFKLPNRDEFDSLQQFCDALDLLEADVKSNAVPASDLQRAKLYSEMGTVRVSLADQQGSQDDDARWSKLAGEAARHFHEASELFKSASMEFNAELWEVVTGHMQVIELFVSVMTVANRLPVAAGFVQSLVEHYLKLVTASESFPLAFLADLLSIGSKLSQEIGDGAVAVSCVERLVRIDSIRYGLVSWPVAKHLYMLASLCSAMRELDRAAGILQKLRMVQLRLLRKVAPKMLTSLQLHHLANDADAKEDEVKDDAKAADTASSADDQKSHTSSSAAGADKSDRDSSATTAASLDANTDADADADAEDMAAAMDVEPLLLWEGILQAHQKLASTLNDMDMLEESRLVWQQAFGDTLEMVDRMEQQLKAMQQQGTTGASEERRGAAGQPALPWPDMPSDPQVMQAKYHHFLLLKAEIACCAANTLEASQMHENAANLALEAVTIRSQLLPPDAPSYISAINLTSYNYRRCNKIESALLLLNSLHDALKQHLAAVEQHQAALARSTDASNASTSASAATTTPDDSGRSSAANNSSNDNDVTRGSTERKDDDDDDDPTRQTRWAMSQVLRELASCYLDRHEYEQAADAAQTSLQYMEKVLGADHPQVFAILDVIAGVQLEQGKYEECARTYQRVIDLAEAADPLSKNTVLAYVHMARLLDKYMQQKEAALVWAARAAYVALNLPLSGLSMRTSSGSSPVARGADAAIDSEEDAEAKEAHKHMSEWHEDIPLMFAPLFTIGVVSDYVTLLNALGKKDVAVNMLCRLMWLVDRSMPSFDADGTRLSDSQRVHIHIRGLLEELDAAFGLGWAPNVVASSCAQNEVGFRLDYFMGLTRKASQSAVGVSPRAQGNANTD